LGKTRGHNGGSNSDPGVQLPAIEVVVITDTKSATSMRVTIVPCSLRSCFSRTLGGV